MIIWLFFEIHITQLLSLSQFNVIVLMNHITTKRLKRFKWFYELNNSITFVSSQTILLFAELRRRSWLRVINLVTKTQLIVQVSAGWLWRVKRIPNIRQDLFDSAGFNLEISMYFLRASRVSRDRFSVAYAGWDPYSLKIYYQFGDRFVLLFYRYLSKHQWRTHKNMKIIFYLLELIEWYWIIFTRDLSY